MFADGGGRVWVRGYCLPAISSPSTPSSCQLAPWPPPSHPEPPTPPPPTSSPPGTSCPLSLIYIQRVTFTAKSVSLPSQSVNFFSCSNAENIQQHLLYTNLKNWNKMAPKRYQSLFLPLFSGWNSWKIEFWYQKWISSKHQLSPNLATTLNQILSTLTSQPFEVNSQCLRPARRHHQSHPLTQYRERREKPDHPP